MGDMDFQKFKTYLINHIYDEDYPYIDKDNIKSYLEINTKLHLIDKQLIIKILKKLPLSPQELMYIKENSKEQETIEETPISIEEYKNNHKEQEEVHGDPETYETPISLEELSIKKEPTNLDKELRVMDEIFDKDPNSSKRVNINEEQTKSTYTLKENDNLISIKEIEVNGTELESYKKVSEEFAKNTKIYETRNVKLKNGKESLGAFSTNAILVINNISNDKLIELDNVLKSTAPTREEERIESNSSKGIDKPLVKTLSKPGVPNLYKEDNEETHTLNKSGKINIVAIIILVAIMIIIGIICGIILLKM